MNDSLKFLWFDILRMVLIILAVLCFLNALLLYFKFFHRWSVLPPALMKLPLFSASLFSILVSNKALARVLDYFTAGLIFLLLNFLVEVIQLRIYAEKK